MAGRAAPVRAAAPGNHPRPAERHDRILQLQRLAGNQALGRLVAGAVQRINWSMATTNEKADAYKAACDRNDAQRTRLLGYIQAGAAQDRDLRLRNSCEWAQQGRSKVYALTGTHDAREVHAASGLVPYFPYRTSAASSAASIYDPNPHYLDPNAPGINFETQVVRRGPHDMGFRQGTDIAIVMHNPISDALNTQAAISITLKHETQHMADRHPEGNDALTSALETYKTEYRAYSLMGDVRYDQWPTDEAAVSGGPQALWALGYTWPNMRQLVILSQIYSEYKEVRDAWDAENLPSLDQSQRPFHNAVRAFTVPVTVNPVNSIRVDNFYNSLDGLTAGDDANSAPVKGVADKHFGTAGDPQLEKLTKADADAILAGPFEDTYGTKLHPTAWRLIFQKVNGAASATLATLWHRWT